jgi:hypothetical protein
MFQPPIKSVFLAQANVVVISAENPKCLLAMSERAPEPAIRDRFDAGSSVSPFLLPLPQ